MECHLRKMENLMERLVGLGQEILEKMKFVLMLCSLPEQYSALIIALEVRPIGDLTYSIVKNAMLGEYKRRESQLKTGDNSEVALKIKKHNNADTICYFCHRPGHIKPNCPRYLKYKSKVSRLKAHAVQEAIDESDNSDSDSTIDFAFIAHNLKKQNTWYFDSGASKHMTNDVSF